MQNFLEEEYERTFRHDHWNIGIVDLPIHAFLEPEIAPVVHWLPSPASGKFHADPFGIAKEGRTTIMFEEFDFRSNKGVVSWIQEDGKGGFSRPKTAIELPYHMAYPYLFESGGSIYCIPEIAHGREVGVFRAIDFPQAWTKTGTLVPGVAGVDATVFEDHGLYWLFCTDLDDGPFSKLRAWYASELWGPWKAHPQNPIKTDPRSARPAGTPFRWRGDLYRPAQDCSDGYGGSVTINRVVRLTTTAFHEEPVATVGPFRDGPYTRGVHTLSAVGSRTLVDGKRLAFNRSEMSRRMRESLEHRWPNVLLRG